MQSGREYAEYGVKWVSISHPVGLFAGAYFARYLPLFFQVIGKLERTWQPPF